MKKVMTTMVLAAMLTIVCGTRANAQQMTREPFDVYIEWVDDITYYHKARPAVEFVYGNPDEAAPGFLVVVTPHPEQALTAVLSLTTVNPRDFRVWIESGQIDLGQWRPFSLFTNGLQSLQYLDVRRKNTNDFALFISRDNILERVPHSDVHDVSAIMRFNLRFNFASNVNGSWPKDVACSKAHPGKVMNYHFNFYPGESFLDNKIEGVEQADQYMHQHPERKYYYTDEEVWQCSGWYFHLSYKDKKYIREKINDNHYVIFTLWKDEEHTKPLLMSYFKSNLYPAGTCDDPTMMEKRYNYIAYPHKGFDDWSLFIPWECINYWWKDGITPTKDNHTCIGYFTLTLSNDGKTPATRNDYDYAGWLAIELDWHEPTPEETRRQQCNHPSFRIDKEKRGIGSDAMPGGCTRDYDLYWVWKECLVCGYHFDNNQNYKVYTDTRCTSHNMKEVNRRETDRKKVRRGDVIIVKKTFKVISECQNECCSYREKKTVYTTDETPVPPTPTPTPPVPHDSTGTTHVCPPHDWVYDSELRRGESTKTSGRTTIHPYSEEVLTLQAGNVAHKMSKHTFDGQEGHCYISAEPVSRQLWLAVNKDNNYLGFDEKDPSLLNGISYQETYELIAWLNETISKEDRLKVLLSLPSPEEMQQLIKTGMVTFDTDPVQQITAFYIDSIQVFDGKDRQVPEEKLRTAPEGAKLRIMVGKMGADGQVQMVDIANPDPQTGIVLKASPSTSTYEWTKTVSGKLYRLYFRQCTRCGKLEVVSENKFNNQRYHRSMTDD
ncbi:MAG: hypothetical protein IJQ76_01685 [Prevotella sp.]|nr:hypothetical protein [Prevotella sp.]